MQIQPNCAGANICESQLNTELADMLMAISVVPKQLAKKLIVLAEQSE